MEAHAHDLRAEVDDDSLVEAIKTDWTKAALTAADRVLLTFAVTLTETPGAMRRGHVDALRAEGFDDRAISDAVHIVSYFNYINRIADAVGVDLEDWMPPHPHADRDFGEE
ncbi:MAG: peroxidase [Vicinamibacteria bacterium]|nr:peroxidase [Vicinamibacteria bacterium]